MAERTGLEPATPGVTGRYSNQLNYRSDLRYRSRDTEVFEASLHTVKSVTTVSHPRAGARIVTD